MPDAAPTAAPRVTLRCGARDSRLSRLQTQDAIARIQAALPGLAITLQPMSSPGDEDRATDLRASAPDFFTRYLDDAIRAGAIDLAIHSAKDLPDPFPDDLDWFWLPWSEDPRDALVCRPGVELSDLRGAPVIGISSDRREQWSQARWPDAELRPIRGTIEQRLAQLDAGDYDAVIIALAALNRLGLAQRATHTIPATELAAPPGQGYLAVTFRRGDTRIQTLRRYFLRTITFVGGGPGDATLITEAGRRALESCDVCLYDALVSPELLQYLRPGAEAIFVGKRRKTYAVTRDDLQALLEDHCRRGRQVVHLKGGDPSIFGRLAEQIEGLETLALPYRVIPGVSSLLAATSGTGTLLTRRGVNHGFSVLTCRASEGDGVAPIQDSVRRDLPLVFFMGVFKCRDICQSLLHEGRSPDEPAALIFGAAMPEQTTVYGTLATLPDRLGDAPTHLPGLLVVGPNAAEHYQYRHDGALGGRRVLLTCSRDITPGARAAVHAYGGRPIDLALVTLGIEPTARPEIENIDSYDWIVLTSPSAVRCLLDLMRSLKLDLRRLPKILVNGPGTAAAFETVGIRVDAMPDSGFHSRDMLVTAQTAIPPGSLILRLRSNKAPLTVTEKLQQMGHDVQDCILYLNVAVTDAGKLPPAEAIFFASSSAVDAYVANWGAAALQGRITVAIGEPTAVCLASHGHPATVTSPISTAPDSIAALAAHLVMTDLTTAMAKG